MTFTQSRWDKTFAKLGRSAPAQRADEGDADYLRRLSRVGRRYIPAGEKIAQVRFDHSLPDATVERFSELMRECVEKDITRVDNMEPGEMRAVMVVDENTGAQQRHWIGPQCFVTDPQYGHRPCRKVIAINAPQPSRLYVARGAEARLARGW